MLIPARRRRLDRCRLAHPNPAVWRFDAAKRAAMLAAMDILIIAYGIACIFGAAVVRGYSGFGFSLLAITALSLALPPAEIVPSIFMLEIAASLHLLPGIWRDIHWRAISLLLIGCAVATPIGVQLLANLPAAPMRIALSVFVVIAVAFLWHGFAFKAMPGPVATVATGVISGLCNGAFGIGGPPAILLFFSARASVAISRASVIAYFLGTDIIGLAFLAEADLTTRDTLWRFLMFMPPLLAGVWLGAHSFKHADPASFRRWVLRILVLLALLTAMQGAVQLLDLMPSKGPAAT